ncbi:hypothetical protein [Pantoea ananatis]|uniref:hypothetical protein n=1 Tax=Pantoea ananas TaxID=553 RepID=UPI0021F7B4BB|nr:hypothetical protein [Pantoea ananatis]
MMIMRLGRDLPRVSIHSDKAAIQAMPIVKARKTLPINPTTGIASQYQTLWFTLDE